MDKDEKILDKIVFSDETTFHKVNHHNVRVFDSENPCMVVEHVRALPPLNFCVWSYVKYRIFIPLLPASPNKLQVHLREAVATTGCDTISRIWNKITYRLVICHITKGSHVDHL